MAISHCYWHLVVKNGNFTLLLTSSDQEWHMFTLLLTSSDQEWQFHIGIEISGIATDILWSRMAISHCYWHLVVKNGNFTLLLTYLLTSSRMAISHCYWHLVVRNGNFTLLLTSSGQEWQNCYWHLVSRMAISHYWHLVVKNGNFTYATDI